MERVGRARAGMLGAGSGCGGWCRRGLTPTPQPDTLDTWLSLARLLCLSFGEDRLSKHRWDRVMELERERESRVAADHPPRAEAGAGHPVHAPPSPASVVEAPRAT